MSAPNWNKVKPQILAKIEAAKSDLTTCAPEDLASLQARVAVLEEVIGLFENPEDDSRKVSDPGGY